MSENSSDIKTLTCSTLTTNSDQNNQLSRNASFSRLNAKAPEFVPMKPTSIDPRLVIVPPTPTPTPTPPPPPPPSFVHVLPPRAVMNHFQQYQVEQHHNNANNSNNSSNNNGKKLSGKEKSEKDHGNVVALNINHINNGLSEEAVQKLINQVEYYFSDVNLATTDHLIKFIFKDSQGFVPVSVVASFKKIKALISSNSQLAAILRNSTKLEVSEDGKKVKRLHPLTISDMEELQARIIVAENLPEDHCHQNLMKIFSVIGSVKSIRTCLPQPSNNGASSASRSSKTDNYNYNKLHAFVEYDSVELAEKAIAELNAEDNWRNGLRVRPLLKPLMKSSPGRTKKAGNEGEVNCEEVSVSTSENEKLLEHITSEPDSQSHEHGEDQSLDKEGGQKKSRNRSKGKGRGRGHNHNHSPNHHSQISRGSHVTVNGEQPVVARQQPPGPRMPDGTRGFSMGRGKPLAVNTA